MEAAQKPIEQMPADIAGDVAGNVLFPFQEEEGVFNSKLQLPSYDNEVADSRVVPAYDSKYGLVSREIYEMEDGTLYPVVSGLPIEARSDTMIGFTTAWLTSTKGHNMRTLLSMMKHGYPTVMIGPEGEEKNTDHPLGSRFLSAMRGNMYKVSHDMNRILDHKMRSMDVEPRQIIALGESRGAMEGWGFGVQEYAGDRKLVYGDFTAPCFPRKAKLREVPGVLLQLLPEAGTAGRLAIDIVKEPFVKHYPATLHSDPEYYAKEIFKVPMLLSGQAGHLAESLPEDTPMHVRIFRHDKWSQACEWQRIFKNFSDVYLEETEGYHLDIASKTTLKNIEARLDVLTESRGFDGDFAKVDFQQIVGLHAHMEQDSGDKSNNETKASV